MVETTYPAKALKCPVSIAVIADFHNTDPSPVIQSVKAHRPDLICIPGDVVSGWIPKTDLFMLEQENVMALLAALPAIAPTFFSLGNHERMLMKRDLDVIEKTGTVILDNTWVPLSVKGQPIALGGLTSGRVFGYRIWKEKNHPGEVYPRQTHPERVYEDEYPRTDWMAPFLSSSGYHVLLCHHPEYCPALPPGVDLILAGHTHGGQIRIGRHGLFAPGQGWLPEYSGGLYARPSSGAMIVSRGLSNTRKQIPRLFNPTEIVYIT